MQTKAMTTTDWYEDGGDELELKRVAVVEDGFERVAAMDGWWIWVRSPKLRSGRVTALCAGVTVDFRDAALSAEGATIYVQSALSGLELLVPPDWEVVCDVDAVFGGVRDQRRSVRSAGPRPRLRIEGMVVAGGLSVR
jgi:Cell wall-active antibiotics response 4TMS YvqF